VEDGFNDVVEDIFELEDVVIALDVEVAGFIEVDELVGYVDDGDVEDLEIDELIIGLAVDEMGFVEIDELVRVVDEEGVLVLKVDVVAVDGLVKEELDEVLVDGMTMVFKSVTTLQGKAPGHRLDALTCC
jgi:hypothetical protein